MYKVHLMKKYSLDQDKVIYSMGAANKTDPTRFTISDIYNASDPMANFFIQKLKKLRN